MIQIRVLSILLVPESVVQAARTLGYSKLLINSLAYHFAGEGVIVKPHNRRDHHERTAQQV